MADFAPPAGPDDYARAHDTLQFLLGAVEADALARRRPIETRAALPVIVVAGFLGAGKTTLLGHLLRAPGGRRITALVNDLAALNIDAHLVAGIHGDTMALSNGCACCTQSGGAARSLLDLLARPEQPDLVLLEASGIADPWALAHVIGALPGVRLDCVVTLIDATTLAGPPASPYLQIRQLSAADLILANKIDLLGNDQIARLTDHLRDLAPKAEIIRTRYAAVPPWLILDGTARMERQADAPEPEPDTAFTQHLFLAGGPLDRAGVEAVLADLPPGVLRAKGFIRLTDSDGRYDLLQMVGRRWTWQPMTSPPDPIARDRLVIIGLTESLDLDTLIDRLDGLGLHPTALSAPD